MKRQPKIIKDYHGFLVDEAIHDLDRLIYLNWNSGREVELIVGRGKIRDAVHKYLLEEGYTWLDKPGNDGCVLFWLEEF